MGTFCAGSKDMLIISKNRKKMTADLKEKINFGFMMLPLLLENLCKDKMVSFA
jgi:hypothetical protein